MKELSIEERAKRYDEVINEIKNLRDNLLEEGIINENGVICNNFNRIFPEIKESEDERTKRRIIEWVVQCKTEASDEERIKEYDSWIAWLKKQGSHQKFYDSIQIGDKVTRNEDGVLVNLSLLNRVAKRVEPTYTQKDLDDAYLKGLEDAKSTEIKEDPCKDCYAKSLNCQNFPCETKKRFDERQGKTALEAAKEEKIDNANKVEPKFEVDSNEDGLIADTIRYKNEQKPVWSEEDEELYKDALDAFEALYNELEPAADWGELYSWLKSLKKRVQPKQEWSEEDEKVIHCLEYTVRHFYEDEDTIKWCCDWLKSLRPQNRCAYNPYKAVVDSIAEMCKHYDKANHSGLRDFYDNVKVKCKDAKEYDSLYPQNTWKPSEEQMTALDDSINYLCNTKHFNEQILYILEDLQNQLKTL